MMPDSVMMPPPRGEEADMYSGECFGQLRYIHGEKRVVRIMSNKREEKDAGSLVTEEEDEGE